MAVLRRERRSFANVYSWIESHIESPEELSEARLAKVTGLSPSRFQAAFKQETGIPLQSLPCAPGSPRPPPALPGREQM